MLDLHANVSKIGGGLTIHWQIFLIVVELYSEVNLMTDKKTFGSFIKLKRIEKNYSQKDLAQMLYVTEGAVSEIYFVLRSCYQM